MGFWAREWEKRGRRMAESSGILKKIRGRRDMATLLCSKAVSASATGDISSQMREGGPLRPGLPR